MKRIVVLVSILLTVLAVAQAQKPVYYDTFNQKWLDPAKWLAFTPWCWTSALECVREIQNGRLRLEIRNVGATDSDSGFQYSDNSLSFVNPNAINSITADVALGRVNVIGCSTNPGLTTTIVKVTGTFFNTGSGDPADDVSNDVYFLVDSSNPKTMQVGDWLGYLGIGSDLGSYPIGTPLTITNTWDKANHQFIAVAKVTGDDGAGKKVVVPYSVSDTTPPTWSAKYFTNMVYSLNCTSAQTFAGVEAFFDNVMINQ
jgi:hypothetical protein